MTFEQLWGLAKDGGGLLLALLTVVQVVPIKINPWDPVLKAVGALLNRDVVAQLQGLRGEVAEIRESQRANAETLQDHIRADDERDTDLHRYRILRFNTEILRDQRHTKEEFDEVLYSVKCYEHYCDTHKDYENDRAVMAIENIENVYRERMKKRDFL